MLLRRDGQSKAGKEPEKFWRKKTVLNLKDRQNVVIK